jgi:hypothetical protein
VWESYKTVEQVFLPGAANPGPWDTIKPPSTLAASLSAKVSSGSVRLLKMDSKVSRPVLSNIARHGASMDPTILNSITQAAGGTLYDLNGNPVYYEVAMNRDEYEYIVQNGLCNANTQATYAQTTDIVLPSGQSKYGQYGALEVKAAWKILTPVEFKSGRFHTVQALIPGTSALAPVTVTVGLVGFHMYLPDIGPRRVGDLRADRQCAAAERNVQVEGAVQFLQAALLATDMRDRRSLHRRECQPGPGDADSAR